MKESLRMCIACRQMKSKKELFRVVKNGDEIVIDTTGKLDGRGAYICKNKNCVIKAEKTKAINRAFKMQVEKEFYDKILKLEEF